jgi:valyl-tRNA synthetase
LDVVIGEQPTVVVNSETICFGADAIISATPTPEGIYNYSWTVPSGASNPGNVASFTATVAGSYTVTITTTGTAPCSSDPVTGTLTINPEITTSPISHD